jgi:hypothetical protein
LRISKDRRISELEDEYEKLRLSTQNTINIQNIQIQTHYTLILKHESTIISLKEIITKKQDVEKQLESANNHINSLLG